MTIIKGLTNILSVDFNKDLKIFPWGKIVFSTNSVERTAHTYEKKKKNLNLVPYTKMNSKWIIELNVRAKLRKLLEESKEKIFVTALANDFLGHKQHKPLKFLDKLNFIEI